MSNLTKHVEQLAKELVGECPWQELPDKGCQSFHCRAARLMTAMANETEAARRSRDADKAYEAADVGIEEDDYEKLYIERVSARTDWDTARRELDALIPKEVKSE